MVGGLHPVTKAARSPSFRNLFPKRGFTRYKRSDANRVQLRKHGEQVQIHRDVLLELARSDKSDLEKALRNICSRSAATLEVERVSYWSLQENNSAIDCEVLYLRSAKSCDEQFKGAQLEFSDCPAYFDALATKQPIVADRVLRHPATSALEVLSSPAAHG
jgi:hypothetical protein